MVKFQLPALEAHIHSGHMNKRIRFFTQSKKYLPVQSLPNSPEGPNSFVDRQVSPNSTTQKNLAFFFKGVLVTFSTGDKESSLN